MKKILLLIATEKGYVSLKRLIKQRGKDSVGCVATFHEKDVARDWAYDIEILCRENDIHFFWWNDIKDRIHDVIWKNHITGVVAISWKYYIPLEINEGLEDDLVIFHDSMLPKYRGFAPTPTAMINGEREIGITALFASEQIDCGDIILQKKFLLHENQYIADVIKREAELYGDMLMEVIEGMEAGNLNRIPQNHSEASYSLWRDMEDCHINWNRDARDIYNFIRGLGDPYLGAYTFVRDRKMVIDRASIMDYDLDFAVRDAGKIWEICDGCPIVVCGRGLLKIEKAHYEDGQPVVFHKLRVRLK